MTQTPSVPLPGNVVRENLKRCVDALRAQTLTTLTDTLERANALVHLDVFSTHIEQAIQRDLEKSAAGGPPTMASEADMVMADEVSP